MDTLRIGAAARGGEAEVLADHLDLKALAAEAEQDHRRFWGSVLDSVRPDTSNGRGLRALAERKLAVPSSDLPVGPEQLRSWLAELPGRYVG